MEVTKMKKIFTAFLAIFLLASCTYEPEPITWNSSPYSVKKSYKPEPNVYSADKYSVVSVYDQEINGAICDVSFDFESDKLISVSCTYKSAQNSEDQKALYTDVKSAISLTYGEPQIVDEIRKNETDHTEYRYSEWSDDVTNVQLSYNFRYTDEYNVNLTYYSVRFLEEKELKNQQETQIVQAKGDNGYFNYIKWPLQTPYAFAVEISDYDGDIFSAGKYTFSVSNTKLGEAPIYDIYIKDKKYQKFSELGSADFSVGGANSSPITYDLKKGDYVYVVPYTKLVYEPKGYLEIKQ